MKTTVYIYNLDSFKSKIEQLNKKCKKYKLDEITYSIVRESYQTIDNGNLVDFKQVKFKQYEIDIVAPDIISIDNFEYKLIAKIEIRDTENLIFVINEITEIPNFDLTFWQNYNTCDNCHSERNRKFYFIIQNKTTGSLLSFGSTCVKEYFGIEPEIFLMQNEYSLLKEENLDDDFFKKSPTLINIKTFLLYTLYALNKWGYISKKNEDYDKVSTSTVVLDLLFDKDFKLSPEFISTNEKLVEQILEFIKSIEPGNNEFKINLRAIAQNDFIKVKDTGFVAYMPVYYFKNTITEIVSGHFGQVNSKYTLDLLCTKITSTETSYGLMMIYTFKFESFIFVYKGKDLDIEKDKSYNISFKVKGHSVWNGINQTEINYVKINKLSI